MSKPCAVFWDIEDMDVPKGHTVTSIVNLIRSTIIKPHNLDEISFFCVGDVHKLSSNVCHSLIALGVDIVQAYNGIKNSADIKIMELMRKFVKFSGQDCTIILLSEDDYHYGTLTDLKKLHNVSIHLIRLRHSWPLKLDKISTFTFRLNNVVLRPVKTTGSPKYFIFCQRYPHSRNIRRFMNKLNDQTNGSIKNSAILFDNLICIGFPTLWNAERAIEQLNGFQTAVDTFLKVELIVDSPLTEILKCINIIKSDRTILTKSNKGVKQLTFIKMNNSNEADGHRIMQSCTVKSGSQCILSRKPFLWIVFSFKSDAEKFLPKCQEVYPDAVISESPSDLALAFYENPYTVEPCKLKVTDETTLNFEADNCNKVKPEMAMQINAQYQSSSSKPAVDIHLSAKSKASKESVETSQEPQNIDNRDLCGDNELNMYFYWDDYSVCKVLACQPTKWERLYNLFEKLYDLGAKKVIYDRHLYCAHFDSSSAYQEALERIHSCYLEVLQCVYVSDYQKQQVSRKICLSYIPWCLNQELDLCCLMVKIESKHHVDFIKMSRNILRNRECIFIKSIPGEIWIGFPDELICENSKRIVEAVVACCTRNNDVSMAKPSNEILQSLRYYNLVGDAYDLAFLSRLLEGSDSIDRPNIIERISLQRMEEKECNEALFHIAVKGNFNYQKGWHHVWPESKYVKIFINFSRVIPLAAIASYTEVKLIYNSWHEAAFARNCINKLKTAEVPYFEVFRGVPGTVEKGLLLGFSEYYIINDQRKVLEKIVQNKNQVNKADLNSSKVQEASEIDVLDRKVAQKLQFLFVITANSEFTSGMISIIKMHLIQMECPACIEFQDKIWVAVDDLEKGNRAKALIEKIKFKLLHETEEDDFDVRAIVKFVSNFPPEVVKMLTDKLINSTKTHTDKHTNWYLDNDTVPLGHFNYNYRKAVGMSTRQYFQSMELV